MPNCHQLRNTPFPLIHTGALLFQRRARGQLGTGWPSVQIRLLRGGNRGLGNSDRAGGGDGRVGVPLTYQAGHTRPPARRSPQNVRVCHDCAVLTFPLRKGNHEMKALQTMDGFLPDTYESLLFEFKICLKKLFNKVKKSATKQVTLVLAHKRAALCK